ncbi:MAG: hypothetical protein KGL39_27960 [Patescibacteria group bacterium]|nr:hypothetical protein [Patescibacteria group bacterium]
MNTEQLFAVPSYLRPSAPSAVRPRSSAVLRQPGKTLGLVKIFGREPGPYTLTWLARGTSGPRRRTMRADWTRARKAAEAINTALTNSRVALAQLDEASAAEYLRAAAVAARLGRSVESIVLEHAELLELLDGRATPRQAAEFYRDQAPKTCAPVTVPKLVEDLLTEKADEDISAGWLAALTKPLKRFADAFTGPLQLVTAAQLNTWLRGLRDAQGRPLGPRSRHNYRAAVDQLVRWARANGHLPRAWSEMEHVADPGARMGEVRILTPEQCAALMAARAQAEACGNAEASFIPFLALQAFAGIRHEEMNPLMNPKKLALDWSHVHLADRYVYVQADVAKTGRDRTVPISDNLAAWLEPYAKPNGPVCPFTSTSSALTRAKKAAGIAAGENQTRNVLRKSFISYRKAIVKNLGQLAEEAGNSPAIIKKHYARIIPESEAKRWFEIWPTNANVLQLNFAGI